jgi:Lon protease-like protein
MQPLSDLELGALRIFPLSGVTLFPHGVLPLHVFEPRYRKLVEDCLEGGHPIAPWGIDERLLGSSSGPGLHPVATAGRIRSHRRLDDGRFDIIVEGIERVRLVEERDSASPYRLVAVERHPLLECGPGCVDSQVVTLKSLAGVLALEHPRAARLLQVTLDRCSDPAELSDVLCAIAHDDASLRQLLLETSSIPDRLDKVIETLSTLLLRSQAKGESRGEVQ